jgi:parvulin-like peptidyl-prolyl isomerase
LAKKAKNGAKEEEAGTKGLKVYKVNEAASKDDKARRDRNIQTFLIVLIIILAIAAIFSAIQTFFPNVFIQQNFITNIFGGWSRSGQLAARVNNQPITVQELDTEYGRMPLQYQYVITKEAFLTQIIDETLLMQEAARQKLSISEQEVDDNLKTFMADNNVSQAQLDDILKQKKLTAPELRELIRNQLIIDKLLETEVKNKVNVTDEQALQYYNDNPSTFKVPERVTAKHILIGLVNRTPEEAKKLATDVLSQLKEDNSNFCDLVKKHSDDSGSLDTCGEYTFPRGQMVPEFENTAFEQGIGKLSLVNTSFGYHILWTINKTPESLVLFKDVEDQIKLVLANQQQKIIYSELLVKLRENAKIVNYLEEEAKKAAEKASKEQAEQEETEKSAEAEKPAAAKTQVTIIEPAKTEAEKTAEESTSVEEENKLVEEQKQLENEIEKSVEEVTEETEKTEEKTEPKTSLGFADCLKSEGAVLFGAYWDSSTKTQKDYFGADASKINYIECGVANDFRAQQAICTEAGIQAYPTWLINNEKHMGILELKQLATLTGCEI